MLNLSLQSDREALEQLISDDIEAFCSTHYPSGHRNHLGASELGEECWRKLWYGFRWVKKEQFSGRMLRLFNVGHAAEPRFVTYLRGIGFEVKEFAEDGKQFRISGAMGHYGGSLDGMCKAPSRYQLQEDIILLLEMKTNNTGKGFTDVTTKGLQKTKPKHFAQMSQYGMQKGLRYGLYLIENKNDSDLIVKIIELDWNLGKQLEKKAEDIIFSKEPPPRISENPAWQACQWCDKKGICHNGEQPEKNCRSCRHSEPVENAEWLCHIAKINIPEAIIPIGCPQWLAI